MDRRTWHLRQQVINFVSLTLSGAQEVTFFVRSRLKYLLGVVNLRVNIVYLVLFPLGRRLAIFLLNQVT